MKAEGVCGFTCVALACGRNQAVVLACCVDVTTIQSDGVSLIVLHKDLNGKEQCKKCIMKEYYLAVSEDIWLHLSSFILLTAQNQSKIPFNWGFTLIFFMQSVTESPKMHLMAGARPFFWNAEPMSPHFCCSPLDTTHHRRRSVCWQMGGGWGKRKKVTRKRIKNRFTFFLTVHCFHSVVIVWTHPSCWVIWLHFYKWGGWIREEEIFLSIAIRRKKSESCLFLQRVKSDI